MASNSKPRPNPMMAPHKPSPRAKAAQKGRQQARVAARQEERREARREDRRAVRRKDQPTHGRNNHKLPPGLSGPSGMRKGGVVKKKK